MGLKVNRLLNTPLGQIMISILLGLGLATLFRKACKGKNCIHFSGPIIDDINHKIYKYGDSCYQYELKAAPKCQSDKIKRTVDIAARPDTQPQHPLMKMVSGENSSPSSPSPPPPVK